jgi:hypothetical protein
MIGNPDRDRWRGSQRFMDAAKIVMRDVQRHGRNVVDQLL